MDFKKEYFNIIETNIDVALDLYHKYQEYFGEFDHNDIQIYHDYKYRLLKIDADVASKEKIEQYCKTLEKKICSVISSKIRSLCDLGYI